MNLSVRKVDSIEHTLIELQGEVKVTDDRDGVYLGKLKEVDGRNTFTIGNHILLGKTEKLGKPLLLARKIEGGLEIIGFINKKILFNQRPAPIPEQTEKKLKTNFWAAHK